MSYAAAHKGIRERVEAVWSSTVVQYPNRTFEIPEAASWVRLKIADNSSAWASMGDPGNNIERNLGQVTAQVFVLAGAGEGDAVELADLMRAVFRSWTDTSSGVRFEVPPYARLIGVRGKWYQINVVAPFRFDDYT